MQVVGWPIRGTRSWTEEVAWLVAYGAASEARWHVAQAALAERLQAVEQQKMTSRRQVAGAEAALGAAGEALAAVQQSASTIWRRRLQVAVAGATLALVLLSFADWRAALLAVIPAAAALGFLAARARLERAGQAGAEARARDALRSAKKKLEEARSAAAECDRRHAEVLAQRTALIPPSRLQGVGRIHLALTRLDTGQHLLALDLSGVTATTAVEVPELGGEPEVLERIRRAVEDARSCPVVLAGDTTPGHVDTLHGLERALHAAVEEFADMLQRSPVLSVRLSLVARDAPLMGLSREPASTAPGAHLPGLTWCDTSRAVAADAGRLVAAAHRLHRTGRDVATLLNELQHGIESVVTTYDGLRHEALERLHTAVDEVLEPTELLYVTWYCPKCNRVPAYLFHRLGVDLEDAHRADPTALFDALQNDSETRERIVADEGLLVRIQDAWTALREIEATIEDWKARWRARESGAPDLLEVRAHEARLRALSSQYREHLEQFRGGLRHAVTGNRRPLIELSGHARLYLDPDTRLWSCGVCGTTFADAGVAAMGRMLKIKDQLLMPMWNHLWVEKDDFRKSELFRTNEQIQRLVEKEVAALRDVSEQYRADMRPVRENLILAVTDARTRRGQLAATLDSLVAVGLAPLSDSAGAAARLAVVTGGELEDYRRHAEAKETLLNKEPQEQMQRRLPAVDPLHQFLTPETLFRTQETQPDRLLPGPSDEASA